MVGLPPKPTVPEMLHAAAGIYEERNLLYQDNYKRFGPILKELFPDGIVLKSTHDMNRFSLLIQMLAKFTRYGMQFSNGGHADSLDDLAVYAMMLQEVDRADPPF